MKQNIFPEGWNKGKVQRVIDSYEQQTEEEAVAEDEAFFDDNTHTFMEIPHKLVPLVRTLIAEHQSESRSEL